MNNTTDNLLRKALLDNELIDRLAILSDELELEKRYSDSQDIDDIINMMNNNMQKESGIRDSFDSILKLFKNVLNTRNPRLKKRLQKVIENKSPGVRPGEKEKSLKDILDRQWGFTDEPNMAKDYTGELYK